MSSKLKLYEQVAEKIRSQIEKGTLGSGAKVPSVRRFSRQLGVSTFTVVQAYWVLENRGVLESRPSSGFYVRPAEKIPSSPPTKSWGASPIHVTNAKQLDARIESFEYMMAATTNPANLFLSMGFPGLALWPFKSLQKSLKSGWLKPGLKAFEYNWPFGYEPLRRQIARHYFECGLEISSDQVLLTSGCVESLNVAYRMATRPGDIVAVESPNLFAPMCLQHYRVKILEIPSDPEAGMDLDFLERALKKYPVKACFSIPNFRNPMGSLMSEARKERLVQMLARKNAILIENDIYGDIHFGKIRPRPAKAFDKTGNVLLVSSFSKTVAPGLKVGWIIVGKDMRQAVASKFIASSSTNSLMEAAMTDFMERGEYVRHLRKIRKHSQTSLQTLRKTIQEHFPAGTKIGQPQGGVVCWVELPGKFDSSRLHREALAQNILVYPGPSFCLMPKFKNCISLGFGNNWSDSIENALKTLGDLAKKQLTEKN